MKDTVGMLLRESWKAKGKPHCTHPELSPEQSCSAVMTGAYICTTCGSLIEGNNSEKDKL